MTQDKYAKNRLVSANLYGAVVEMARRGDKNAAETLIAAFAPLSEDPEHFAEMGGIPAPLLQHIATCIADWQKRSFRDAEFCFFVEKPDHRPTATAGMRTKIRALRIYLLLIARGKGREVARGVAANACDLTEVQVRYLVEKKDPYLRERVLAHINPRLHKRVLSPPRKKYQRRV